MKCFNNVLDLGITHTQQFRRFHGTSLELTQLRAYLKPTKNGYRPVVRCVLTENRLPKVGSAAAGERINVSVCLTKTENRDALEPNTKCVKFRLSPRNERRRSIRLPAVMFPEEADGWELSKLIINGVEAKPFAKIKLSFTEQPSKTLIALFGTCNYRRDCRDAFILREFTHLKDALYRRTPYARLARDEFIQYFDRKFSKILRLHPVARYGAKIALYSGAFALSVGRRVVGHWTRKKATDLSL
ncbi:MAG: hypothetical protein AB7E52_08625 [Bdellovibrionales bacterium]